MPGILGIISKRALDDELIESMVNSLNHENWYKIDKYNEEFFAIARVHLGVFNPTPQPIFNEDGTLCILMEGKIYDYTQRMVELKRRGHRGSSCFFWF